MDEQGQRSTLHGRSAELDALVATLTPGVTALAPGPHRPRRAVVHGPPGVGKTALVSAARELLSVRYAGVVTLAVRGAPGLRRALAAHLGLAEPHDLGRIAAAVDGDRLLLVVDPPYAVGPHLRQAERQLVDDLDRLVDACPGVAVVLTAQRAGSWPGARDIAVRPLPVPRRGLRPETLRHNPAVALVLDRIALVDPTLEATDEVVAAVADICRGVGGLPLALELAAARTHGFGIDRLAATVRGGTADLVLLSRHRSPSPAGGLRGALELSYATLGEQAQRLLRQASVLRGPFDLGDLRAVSDLPPAELVDALDELNDLHLVSPEPPADTGPDELGATDASPGPARLAVDPVTAELGAELLELAGESDTVRARHARHFGARARRAGRATAEAREGDAIALLEPAAADLAAALTWLGSSGDRVGALRLAVDLAPLGRMVGERDTLHDVLEEQLQTVADAPVPDDLLAEAEICSAALALEGLDPAARVDPALRRLHSGIERARRLQGRLTLLRGFDVAARTAPLHRDVLLAHRSVVDGLTIARRIGHVRWLARFEAWRAMIHHQALELDAAADLGATALRRAQQAGDSLVVLRAGILLRTLPPEHVDRATGIPTLEELLRLAERVGDAQARSLLLGQLATRAAGAGDAREAARWTALRLEHIARTGTWATVGYSFMTMARVAALRCEPGRAARFHGAATPMLPQLLAGLAPAQRVAYEDAVSEWRSRLGSVDFERAAAAGAGLGMAQAYAEVLGYARDVAPAPGETSTRDGTAGAGALAEPTEVTEATGVAEAAEPTAGDATSSASASLSTRELELLALVASGHPTSEIARVVHDDVGDVLDDAMAVYRKLGVRGPAEAAALAMRRGLV